MMMHGGSGFMSFLRHDDSKDRPKIDRQLLTRAFQYAKPYMKMVMAVLSIIIFTSLLGIIPPLLYRDLFDTVIPTGNITRLNWLALGMIGIPIVSNLMDVGRNYFSAKLGEGIIFDLRQELYNHLQSMSLRFFTHTRRGEIVSRLNSDVVGAQSAVTNTIPNVITNSFTLITTLIVMLSIEWRLTLLSVILLPLFLLPARRVGRTLRDVRRKSMEYNADMTSIISETLTINGSLLVKTFGRQKQERQRYQDTNVKVRDIGVRRAMVMRWFFMGLSIATTLGAAFNYYAGGYFAILGTISAGTIVAFVAYLARLYMPISSLANVQIEVIQSMVSFERVFEYLDLPVEIEDKPGSVVLSNVKGKITFKDVSFDYMEANERLGIKIQSPEKPKGGGRKMMMVSHGEGGHGDGGHGDGGHESKAQMISKGIEKNGDQTTTTPDYIPTRRWALQDINFEINPGQLIALVGPSGGGKTTLTYLLPRLYDPTEGQISLDGHDLRDVTQESLAAQMGVVTQETYLFHDTIRSNVAYGRPDASEADLVAAAKAANIYEFIEQLPDGFETIVGERGYRLSGGEKQRLSIARVILKDPRILVLDEATSHLDSHSEALIQEALELLMKDRTSIVIAHRLSTILSADKILVMDKGKLVEQGTHKELLDEGGIYALLYDTQFRLTKVKS